MKNLRSRESKVIAKKDWVTRDEKFTKGKKDSLKLDFQEDNAGAKKINMLTVRGENKGKRRKALSSVKETPKKTNRNKFQEELALQKE
ncbi:hypothetical protein Tco_1384566 [Tanacetum coccineum]